MRNEIIFEYRFNIFYVLQNCLQISYSAYNIFSRVTVSICIDYGSFVLVCVIIDKDRIKSSHDVDGM